MTAHLTGPQQQVVETIQRIRDEHHCCTAAWVATTLRLNKTYVLDICASLRKKGVVDWSPGYPGSLHVVTSPAAPEGPAEHDQPDDPAVEVAEPVAAPVAGTKPKRPLTEAQRLNLAKGREAMAAKKAARLAGTEVGAAH